MVALVRRQLVDGAIGGALFLAALAFGLTSDASASPPVVVIVAALLTLPLTARRRAPLLTTSLVVCGVVLLVVGDVEVGVVVVPAVAIAAFTAGRELGPPQAQVGLAVTVGWLPLLFATLDDGTTTEDMVIGTTIFAAAWLLGRTLRARALDLEAERVALQRLQRDAEAQAREEERARIARELHDIVSHSVSVITLQAESVRRRLHPEQQVEAARLRDIETSARHAMVELRMLLGTLQRDDEPAPLAPQPGLDQLARLLEKTNDAGLPVALEIEGEPQPLPAGVDLAAYRIVQEALTNALRHAGAATARVHVGYARDELRILVEDTGKGSDGAPAGRGLIGMHERVSLLGGRLAVEDGPSGGLRVDATLPIRIGAPA